jgi:conjugative relaxase-like TrwC/TraI family protein
MLKISKPLSIGTTKSYYKAEYTKSSNAYYTQEGQLQGQWHGKLAEEFGLRGTVTEAEYDRLVEGQHPRSGQQLIKHRDTVLTKTGQEVAHRAAWDLTFGAPKSVSVTALVGGDERVRQAHQKAVTAALDATESYVQAHIGGNHPARTTANLAAALFEHDTSRAVGAAPPDPHLHTHVVVFNMTNAGEGKMRSLETRELFRIQAYSTAVYQSELAMQLKTLGYGLTLGDGYAPEIKGYSKDYLDSVSQRRDEITARMDDLGISGAEAGERLAKQTRAAKQAWNPEDLRAEHLAQARQFGSQHEAVIAGISQIPHASSESRIHEAITHAKERLSERIAVFDRYEVLRDALRVGQTQFCLPELERALDERIGRGEFLPVAHYRRNAPGARYTTPEMVRLEQESIEFVRATQGTLEPIRPGISVHFLKQIRPALNDGQAQMVYEVIKSRDQVHAVQGGAGTGKSFALATVQGIAQGYGYDVKGLAPTSQAANNLAKDGITSEPLQAHLTRGTEDRQHTRPTLYFLDETSLASTKQVHEFLYRLGPKDRVVLIGDTRQHQSVEAGRIFEELQQAGMQTSHVEQVVRQRDPELKAVVEDLAAGNIKGGLRKLAEQDHVHEISHRGNRFSAIAHAYAESPQDTLVVSPDNASRQELNRVIRRTLQEKGIVSRQEFVQPILVARQEITGADRKRADSYKVGNVVRFQKSSKTFGFEKKTYATVIRTDREQNKITVHGKDGTITTYDPSRFYGVQIYDRERREFAVGDRVQFTTPWREKGIATRQLGTIAALDQTGNAEVKLDTHKQVRFNLNRMAHVEHGYAVTSHSSQGLTVDRTLLQIDTGDPKARAILGRELAYVAVSRARFNVDIFTDNAERLTGVLDRTQEKSKALSPEEITRSWEPRTHEQDFGMSM